MTIIDTFRPAPATLSVRAGRSLAHAFRAYLRRRRNRRDYRYLASMSEYALKDIGLTRNDVNRLLYGGSKGTDD